MIAFTLMTGSAVAEWRFALVVLGELSVMTTGPIQMHQSSVISWDFLNMVCSYIVSVTFPSKPLTIKISTQGCALGIFSHRNLAIKEAFRECGLSTTDEFCITMYVHAWSSYCEVFWKCACALLDIKGAINGRHGGQ